MVIVSRHADFGQPSALLSRRNFLRGRRPQARAGLRPPWSLPESEFTAACTRCPACRAACPQRIIAVGDGGFPEIDFQRGECTFCGACREACAAGAFAAQGNPPWRVDVQIGTACLTLRNVVCRSCAEHCEADAIIFKHNAAEVARPAVDAARCSGCGACVAPCPSRAITVRPRPAGGRQ